jgi:hypothetical protein
MVCEPTSVMFLGARLPGNMVRYVSQLTWAYLEKQDYADGTDCRVFVQETAGAFDISARAREPNGPILRLYDLTIPGDASAERLEKLSANPVAGDHVF